MTDLTVACVLRSGGPYRPEHVAGIAAQVAHFLPGARMVCLSDVPVPCERIAVTRSWPGWWAKIALFEHLKGRTLYVDLDTVIVGDPSRLVTGEFLMIANWDYPHLFASGVMSWDGDYSHITRAFEPVAEQVMSAYVTLEQWGDQAFIAEQAGDVKGFPAAAVQSFRRLDRQAKPPCAAAIIAFNGNSLPWHGPRWARRWFEPVTA
jgi:hypothetical protein